MPKYFHDTVPAMCILFAIAYCVLIGGKGCAYAPDDVDDFTVICPSCSTGLTRRTTVIRCRADSVLATCCNTPCRHCNRMLAESGDSVGMTALSGGVFIEKRGRPR